MKVLTVKEFETITHCKEQQESYAYIDENSFQELERFIRCYAETHEEEDILQFLKIGYRRHVGDTITTSNYVGVIQIANGLQIEILPKISLAEQDEDDKKTRKILSQMLRALKEFSGKYVSDADLQTERMSLYEFFIHMYLVSVWQLVKQGLKSAYVNEEANIRYFKGKLLVEQNIRQNLVHPERVFMAFDEYSLNRPANRIIKATLLKLKNISTAASNARKITQLLSYFSEVEPSVHYEADFAKVSLDRTCQFYESLLRWSKVFLKGESFTTFSGNYYGWALLFPMEKIFESYVAKKMKQFYEPLGWKVSAQDQGKYLFDEPKKFRLRPDIVITNEKERQIILDTKWKRLKPNEKVNYGISQADMYQMYAYAHKYRRTNEPSPDVWVIYPLNDDMRNQKSISFQSDDGVTVHVFLLDLERIEESLRQLRNLIDLE